MKENKTLIFSLLTALIVVAVMIITKSCNKYSRQNVEQRSLLDTLTRTKNKDGSETSKIELIQMTNANLLIELSSNDSIIRQLRLQVKNNKEKIKQGGSVTLINSNTTYSSIGTTTISSVQPIIKGDSILIFPVYECIGEDSTWIYYHIKAYKDSTLVKFRSRDKYSVVIGLERLGLFKRKPIVEVTTYNPFNSIKSMRAFEVKDNSVRKISLGLQGGYGITLKGFSPYLGIGINFKLL